MPDPTACLSVSEPSATHWFINTYVCPRCHTSWVDRWTAQCNDACPACGLKDIEPTESEDADEPATY